MKRIAFCFDGTWNRLDAPFPTNVVFTAESILPLAPDRTAQLIHYDEGVGTEKFEKYSGGLFGNGMERNLAEAYRFLVFNYTPGDEIYVFGFSRGAYTARSFCGLLANVGVLRRAEAHRVAQAIALYRSDRPQDQPGGADSVAFRGRYGAGVCAHDADEPWRCANIPDYVAGSAGRLQVTYLGVWDTVGSLGVPDRYTWLSGLDKVHRFHDTELSPFVLSARHAIALDERRKDFAPTLWSNTDDLNRARGTTPDDDLAPYQQRWFPGDHGSVGGGGYLRGLSDQALEWVLDGARACGLKLDSEPYSRIFELKPDFREHLGNMDDVPEDKRPKKGIMSFIMGKLPSKDRANGPVRLDQIDVSALRRWWAHKEELRGGTLYRPGTLAAAGPALKTMSREALGLDFEIKSETEPHDLYEVRPNDTLSRIALRAYGDAARWPVIYHANRHILFDPDRIYAGQNLRVPRRPTTTGPTTLPEA